MRKALIRGRQLLAQPSHCAVEVMEIEFPDAVEAVIVAPVLAGAVGARHDQPMQDRQKDGALDRELKTSSTQKLLDNGLAAGLAPQPIKQQRGADASAVETRCATVLQKRDDHRALRQTRGGASETIEIAARLDDFLAAEILDDALLGRAVRTDGFDQIDVGVRADSFLTEEHANSIRDITK